MIDSSGQRNEQDPSGMWERNGNAKDLSHKNLEMAHSGRSLPEKQPDFGHGSREHFLLGNGKPWELLLCQRLPIKTRKTSRKCRRGLNSGFGGGGTVVHPRPLASDRGIKAGKGRRDHGVQPFPRRFHAPRATSRGFGTIPGTGSSFQGLTTFSMEEFSQNPT